MSASAFHGVGASHGFLEGRHPDSEGYHAQDADTGNAGMGVTAGIGGASPDQQPGDSTPNGQGTGW